MNENWISVQQNTQYLSTMNWTYIGLLQISPSSICVRFTEFGPNSVTFCTIIWHLVSWLQWHRPVSHILDSMKGYPIFWTLDDMATLVFCFLAVR